MAEQQPKDGKDESFFRKVVRFVANPATDWADLNSRQDDGGELDLEKSELKAMIERKRRNDFVRKREFDMLRKMRRDGLSPDQLAALGHSSRIDDSEVRMTDSPARGPDTAVKAKIDEIEQQMVGDGGISTAQRRTPEFYNAPTQPAALARDRTVSAPLAPAAPSAPDPDKLPALPVLSDIEMPPAAAPAPVVMGGGIPPLAAAGAATGAAARAEAPRPLPGQPSFEVEVSEIAHDPELDEAVIAFANADFALCEQSLTNLIGAGGSRRQHADTWLVLFDLYRAIGQHAKFESLAVDYVHQFGVSSPQWFSLPKLVAEAAAEERPSAARVAGEVGWVCPELIDTDAVARLRSVALQLPLPWVFDWSGLRRIDADAAGQLSELFRHWAGQSLEMRWLSGEQLFTVLQEAAPTGVRDADPAYWLLRLDALRIANRPDQFDEAAIDYCVTYEVSPPSWERTKCSVRVSGSSLSTRSPPMSIVSEVSTTFVESTADEAAAGVQVATVELSGQLVGDIGTTLAKLDRDLTQAPIVAVSCARLIRVDFIAAGDLLNWVLAKRSENRAINLVDANRLVALFFGAMGINEHAKVQIRRI
ncbi:MAG: STAS domain-containing protein [Burkholderiaceae bacterium]